MGRSVKVNSDMCNLTKGINPETAQEGGCYAMPDPRTEAVLTVILAHKQVIEFMSYAVVSTTACRII